VTAFSRVNVATARLVQPAGEPSLSTGGVGCLLELEILQQATCSVAASSRDKPLTVLGSFAER
jgi:hypothetical protein